MKAAVATLAWGLAFAAGHVTAQDVRVTPEQIKAAWVGKKASGRNANGVPVEFKMHADSDAEVQVGNANGVPVEFKMHADSDAEVQVGSFYDRGKWRLNETGYCVKWYKLRAGKEACFTVVRRGDSMIVLNEDGTTSTEITKVE
jgi:hypothetical protein